MADDRSRMTELIQILNKASESYYAKDEEIMSNFEYDALYDELVTLEEKTGHWTFSISPSLSVTSMTLSFTCSHFEALTLERNSGPEAAAKLQIIKNNTTRIPVSFFIPYTSSDL